MQWLQDPFKSHTDNLYNVRCKDKRHCSNKKKEYLKAKINYLELGNNPHESKFHLGMTAIIWYRIFCCPVC